MQGTFTVHPKYPRQVDSMNLKVCTTVVHRRGRQLTFGSLSVLASLAEDEENGGDDDDRNDDATDDSSGAARYHGNKKTEFSKSASRYGNSHQGWLSVFI